MSNIDFSALITAEDKASAALSSAKEEAQAALIAWINETTHAITGPVPEDEKLSWTAKEAAARAVLGGSPTVEQGALIAMEAQASGEVEADLCASIIANADAYRATISTLTGLRRKAAAEIGAASTIADVEMAGNVARATWASWVAAQQS